MMTSRSDNALTMKRKYLHHIFFAFGVVAWSTGLFFMFYNSYWPWAAIVMAWSVVLLCSREISTAYRRYFPVKLPAVDTPMEVLLIEPEAEGWYAHWGITQERAMELARIAGDGVPRKIEDTLVLVSKECKHPNELMYISFMLAVFHEQQRQHGILHHVIKTAFGQG